MNLMILTVASFKITQQVNHIKVLNLPIKSSSFVPMGSQIPLKKRGFFMPFAYILYSKKLNKYYVGACIDMERRLKQHNSGQSKFTSTGIPWILKYTEGFDTLERAKSRELQIKKKKSRKYIENLFK